MSPRHHFHSRPLSKGQERFSHHRVLREEGRLMEGQEVT